MNTCMAKRGFLSLSLCGAPATRPCSSCGLMTCPDHLSPASGFNQCLSCANTGQTESHDRNATTDDPDATYRNREHYYSDRGYTPDSTFNRNDSYGFERSAVAGAVAADMDDDGHPGFGDS